MRTILRTLGFLALLCLPLKASEADRTAYICVSKNAKVYHLDRDCRGLNRCNHQIRAVKLKEIAKYRRACKICA